MTSLQQPQRPLRARRHDHRAHWVDPGIGWRYLPGQTLRGDESVMIYTLSMSTRQYQHQPAHTRTHRATTPTQVGQLLRSRHPPAFNETGGS